MGMILPLHCNNAGVLETHALYTMHGYWYPCNVTFAGVYLTHAFCTKQGFPIPLHCYNVGVITLTLYGYPNPCFLYNVGVSYSQCMGNNPATHTDTVHILCWYSSYLPPMHYILLLSRWPVGSLCHKQSLSLKLVPLCGIRTPTIYKGRRGTKGWACFLYKVGVSLNHTMHTKHRGQEEGK